MKSKCFIVLFVIAGFKTLNAIDRILLQNFMKSVLPRPLQTQPAPVPRNPKQLVSILPTPNCPNQVNIAWQLKPPYSLQTNATDDQPNVDGIFHQVLDFALDKCCSYFLERKPKLKYLAVASNTSELFQNIFNENVTFVFPIPRSQQMSTLNRFYINIIESPGVVLIQRKLSYSINRGDDLLKALLGTWPIVVLSLLLSCLAGICIWIFVSQFLLFSKRARVASVFFKEHSADLNILK